MKYIKRVVKIQRPVICFSQPSSIQYPRTMEIRHQIIAAVKPSDADRLLRNEDGKPPADPAGEKGMAGTQGALS